MKKLNKIIIFILIVLLLLFTNSFAYADVEYDPAKILDGTTPTANTTELQELGSNIVTIISTIASIASIVILIVLGIKYMMGSAEEKAEYKKTLIPYIIGAVFVFAASSLAGVVYNFAQNI